MARQARGSKLATRGGLFIQSSPQAYWLVLPTAGASLSIVHTQNYVKPSSVLI